MYPLCEACDHRYHNILTPSKLNRRWAVPFPIPAQIQPPPQAHSERSSPSKCPISAPPERAPAEDRKVDGHQPTVGHAVRKMRKGYRRGVSSRALRYDDQRPSAQNKSLIVYLGSPYTIGSCARLPGLRLSSACVPPYCQNPLHLHSLTYPLAISAHPQPPWRASKPTKVKTSRRHCRKSILHGTCKAPRCLHR